MHLSSSDRKAQRPSAAPASSSIARWLLAQWISWDIGRNIRTAERYFQSTQTAQNAIQKKKHTVQKQYRHLLSSSHVNFVINKLVNHNRESLGIVSNDGSLQAIADNIVAHMSDSYLSSYYQGGADLDNFFPPLNDDFIQLLKDKAVVFDDLSVDHINQRQFGPIDKVIKLAEACLNKGAPEFSLHSLLRKRQKHVFQPRHRHYLAHIWLTVHHSIIDIKAFCLKNGIVFNGDGEIRAFYNLMNLYLHAFVLYGKAHLSATDKELCICAAVLHPIQDDYIDGDNISLNAMAALSTLLKGDLSVPTPCCDVNSTFSVVKKIYGLLPPSRHPRLVEIFTELQKWQCESTRQKDESISTDDMIAISFMKGGWAFALYGYIVLKEMSNDQFIHFFVMGAIFQIMDDLHDLNDDINEDIETVWTREFRLNGNLDKVLMAFISLQQYFEDNTSTRGAFRNPALARFIELFGCRYDTFRFYCMHKDKFSCNINSSITRQFNIDLDAAVSFFAHTREHEHLDIYLDVLADLRAKF